MRLAQARSIYIEHPVLVGNGERIEYSVAAAENPRMTTIGATGMNATVAA
jgi:hypothetical protein